jgi:hypothetical protein
MEEFEAKLIPVGNELAAELPPRFVTRPRQSAKDGEVCSFTALTLLK